MSNICHVRQHGTHEQSAIINNATSHICRRPKFTFLTNFFVHASSACTEKSGGMWNRRTKPPKRSEHVFWRHFRPFDRFVYSAFYLLFTQISTVLIRHRCIAAQTSRVCTSRRPILKTDRHSIAEYHSGEPYTRPCSTDIIRQSDVRHVNVYWHRTSSSTIYWVRAPYSFQSVERCVMLTPAREVLSSLSNPSRHIFDYHPPYSHVFLV